MSALQTALQRAMEKAHAAGNSGLRDVELEPDELSAGTVEWLSTAGLRSSRFEPSLYGVRLKALSN